MDDLIWQNETDRILLSPRAGARILSWRHNDQELIMAPVVAEGGAMRVLFAEEQYPGSSYAAPHRVLSQQVDETGFRTHLRHYWNTANWFMRAAGWPEKANELHLDGLVLDKVVSYDASRSCLTCDMTITNTTHEMKYVTPWLHLSYAPWPTDRWVLVDGERQPYKDSDIYWGNHLAEPGRAMRMVHADEAGKLFAVLGAATEHLRGMSALLPVPGEFHQSTCELRHTTIDLPPHHRWRANSFVALTDDPLRWAREAPVELFSTVEPAEPMAGEACSVALLDELLLPEEREAGLMVLSFHDKPPFASPARFAAAHTFGGFHAHGGKARASVMLYAARDLPGVAAALDAGPGWSLQLAEGPAGPEIRTDIARHAFVRLTLEGPADLAGQGDVAVTLTLPEGQQTVLHVAAGATVEPHRSYQVRQTPAYLQQRYDDRLGPPADADAEALRAWQRRARGEMRRWLASNAAEACPLEPRMVERQEGPTCIREKWLVQTEPGLWVPGFLVYPKGLTGRRPLLYFLHGSGPGKDGFAPDEIPNPIATQLGHELEYMPYRLAPQLNCVVYVPDGRGQGELGETNPAQWPARVQAMGLSNLGLRLWDQMRALDWLIGRADVDPARVGSLGCSGGGQLTYLFAAADERVAASIVSSTSTPQPLQPLLPEGYFHRELIDRDVAIAPAGPPFMSGAPTGMLVAPRPMWIVDGIDDLDIPAERRPQWRTFKQQGRDQIRQAYDLLAAGNRYRDCWLEGGHCAGMTVANVVAWFEDWFADA